MKTAKFGEKGPDKEEWKAFEGPYRQSLYNDIETRHVNLFMGHLYMNALKLTQYTGNVFFTDDGEYVEFFDDKLIVSGVTFQKDSN